MEAASLNIGRIWKRMRRFHDAAAAPQNTYFQWAIQAIWCPHHLNLELKLDPYTMFAWMSEIHPNLPHYKGLLEFISLKAQPRRHFCMVTRRFHQQTIDFVHLYMIKFSHHNYTSTTLLEIKITLYARLKGTNYMLVLSSKIFRMKRRWLLWSCRIGVWIACEQDTLQISSCINASSVRNHITHSCTSKRQYPHLHLLSLSWHSLISNI